MTPPADDFRVALAICSSYGFSAGNIEDAAAEVWLAMRTAPAKKRHAAAHRVARRLLAAELGIPERALPRAPGRAQAVGEWEAARKKCDRPGELFAFDLHSKRFAMENGVCPRCATTGEFTEDSGACSCGFRYGPLGVQTREADDHALEKLRRDARKSA